MKEIVLFLLLFSIIKCQNRTIQNEQIRKICSKCEAGFNETYKDNVLLNNTSDNDKINEYTIFFVEMIKDDFNSSALVDQYVTPRVIYPNIIFMVLIGILVIIWIILIVLVCLNKKFLNFKSNDDDNNFKNHILVYVTALIFIIIIVLSSISLYYVSKSQTYFNSSICSLLRIYIDLREGDQTKTTDWKGIINLQNDLNANENTINQLMNYIDLQEGVTNELKNNKYKEMSFADNEKDNKYYSDSEVTSPSSISSKVYPSYTKNRLEQLTQIYLEYNTKLTPNIEINERITDLNQGIKNDPTTVIELIKNDYLYINRKLDDILDTVQISAEEYLQYLIDISNYINDIAFPLLYSIFSLSIIFALAGIIFIFLYVRDKKISIKFKKILSILLHILWNIILFLLLMSNISQILFKIFEIFGEDGSGLLQYATSEENFNNSDSIIFKGAGKVFLEVCFTDEDANIYAQIVKDMDSKSSYFSKFDNIIKNGSYIIANQQKKIIEKIELSDTQEIINNLENMNNDYSLISYYSSKISIIKTECQDDFDDLNQYTDYSNPLVSKQNKDSSNKHSYDVWTSNKDNCQNYKNYKYINNKDDRTEGNKYCMVIREFDKDIAKNFYSDIKASLLLNVEDKFEDYYQALTKFEEDNKKLLNENPNFIEMTKKYYNELISIKAKIIEGFDYSIKIGSLINELMSGSSNKEVVSDVLSVSNCYFLKRDLKVFYIEMEKLRANSAPFLITSIFVLIFLLCSAILVILNIYKYKGKEEEKIEQIPSNSTLTDD